MKGKNLRADLFASLIICTFLPFSISSRACSVFSLTDGVEHVYGANLDWHTPFPGQVVVNTRGVKKAVLPWKGSWPAPADSGLTTWTSRYGSVTFTCYGRDFIEGGMNEAGLVVDETNLTAVYPPPDDRPGISCPQWMQYQLDNFATVEEVILHLGDLRPDGEGWHYLISDRNGGCAVIEYLSGEASVYSADSLDVRALTNTTYKQALSHIPMDAAFGGEIDIASGSDSYGRFVRMAALLRDYDPKRDGGAAGYAFEILDDVSCEDTIRSIVYDSAGRRVLWKTPGNPRVRWLDLDSIDLCNAGTRFIDVEAGGPGDVSGLLKNYSHNTNLAVVSGVLGPDADDPAIVRKLKSRGLTVERAVEMIAAHPTAMEP